MQNQTTSGRTPDRGAPLSHEPIDDEGHAREIPDILEHSDEQEEHRDLRDKDDNVADTAMTPSTTSPWRGNWKHLRRGAMQRGGQGFDHRDPLFRSGEHGLKQKRHHSGKHRHAGHPVRQYIVDPIRPGAGVCPGYRPDFPDDRLNPSVPSADDLLVDVTLFFGGPVSDRLDRLVNRDRETRTRSVARFER